jgi:hypothetical protein
VEQESENDDVWVVSGYGIENESVWECENESENESVWVSVWESENDVWVSQNGTENGTENA